MRERFQVVATKLPPDYIDHINKMAEEQYSNRSHILRVAVIEYVDRQLARQNKKSSVQHKGRRLMGGQNDILTRRRNITKQE